MKYGMVVVIINGRPGSGKDTFINMCAEKSEIINRSAVSRIDSVKFIKDALRSIGWDGEKTQAVRDILSSMKRFSIGCGDMPTAKIIDRILELRNTRSDKRQIVFVHIREPEEISKLSSALVGLYPINIFVKTVFIERDVEVTATNSSDNFIFNRDDYSDIIHNNSTLEDLEFNARNYIESIKEDYYAKD